MQTKCLCLCVARRISTVVLLCSVYKGTTNSFEHALHTLNRDMVHGLVGWWS